jgi:hypothetical protein
MAKTLKKISLSGEMAALTDVTLFSLVNTSKCFGETYCLHIHFANNHEDGGNMLLRNVV